MDSITLELNNWGFYWDSKNIYTCKDKYSYLQYNRDQNAPHIKIAADFLRFLAGRGVEVDGLALVAGDEDGELHERPVPDAEDRQAQDLVCVHFGVLEIYPQISTAFILLLVHRYFAQYYHVDIVVLILNRIHMVHQKHFRDKHLEWVEEFNDVCGGADVAEQELGELVPCHGALQEEQA